MKKPSPKKFALRALLATPRVALIGLIFLAVVVMGQHIAGIFAVLSGERDVLMVSQSQAEAKATTESDKAPADSAAPPAPAKTADVKTDSKEAGPSTAVAQPTEATAKPTDPAAPAQPSESTATQASPTAPPAPSSADPSTAAESNPLAAASTSSTSTTSTTPAPSGGNVLDGDIGEGEREVLKQLSVRREQLEARAREIEQKGALLLATEQRVDQKLREMESLRTELNKILANVNDQKAGEYDNLVKIYSAMKPTDAAKILSAMDMPVLLGVIRTMKPAASAPILAAMDAQKAKDITTELTRSFELPGAP